MTAAVVQPSPADQSLSITRTFDAPRELVFKAWTDPQMLVRWWGPQGFTVPKCDLDLKIDGAWCTTMHSPEGTDHTVQGTYTEISAPDRLVFTWSWLTDGVLGHQTTVEVDFNSVDGKTELTLLQTLFETCEDRDNHQTGWDSSFNDLDNVCAA